MSDMKLGDIVSASEAGSQAEIVLGLPIPSNDRRKSARGSMIAMEKRSSVHYSDKRSDKRTSVQSMKSVHTLVRSDGGVIISRQSTSHAPTQVTLPMRPTGEEDVIKRDWRFWMIFFCIFMSQFITAMELSAVTTALPTIVNDLHGEQFVWVGSAYTIATTSFVPLSGNFAQIFGRRFTMLISIAFFAVGSALCGAAPSLNFLIAGRTIQGLGGGGIQTMCQIILSDIVPLAERGVFNGVTALAFVIASGTGPVIGGTLAQHGAWRWLFYLNLPICAIVGALVALFLKLRAPPGTLKEKMAKIDYIGNAIAIASTVSIMFGLTWGGVQYPWASFHILVPLILGVAGLVGFMVFEAHVPRYPIVSIKLLTNRTALSGYLQTLVLFAVLLCMLYYMPVYFQACKDLSPTASGVGIFGIAFSVAPASIAGGLSVARSGHYRPQIWVSWSLMMVGMGLLSTITVDTSKALVILFEIIAGFPTGILTAAVFFPVLAPQPIDQNAQALSLYTFFRNFANILGITVGGSVLQNRLETTLPTAFLQQFPNGAAIAYSIIPTIPALAEPLRSEVQVAFAESIKEVWQVMIAFAGLGLLFSVVMKHLPLHAKVDDAWGLEEEKKAADPEALEVGARMKEVAQ